MLRTPVEERYNRDQVFRAIVDTLYSMLCVNHDKLQFTPTEMREAAMLACVKYEYTHVKPLFSICNDGSVFGTGWSSTPPLFGGDGTAPRTATGAMMNARDNAKTSR